MKKVIPFLFLFFQVISVQTQEKEEQSVFINSKEWKREIIQFPIDWAPGVNLKGFEELLFAPKWADKESEEFWSLVMGWKVKTLSNLSIEEIKRNFKAYFDGLMKPNHWAKNFPEPTVHLRKGKQGFYGTMIFFDGFHTGKVIKVNILGKQIFHKIHNKSIISFRISPKSFQHEIWKRLTSLKTKRDEFDLIDLDSTWGQEVIIFPARNMSYNGIGEVRFPPKGWINPRHPNFWSYTYAWKINVDREIPEKELEIDLVKYFNSLNNIDMTDTQNDQYSLATVHKINQKYLTTFFKGQVNIFDRFATKKRITLNVSIESNYCEKEKRTVLLFKFSPQEYSHSTWDMLNMIRLKNSSCE